VWINGPLESGHGDLIQAGRGTWGPTKKLSRKTDKEGNRLICCKGARLHAGRETVVSVSMFYWSAKKPGTVRGGRRF